MHRKIRLDCGGRSARQVMERLSAELSAPKNGRRIVLWVDNLQQVEDSLVRLLRQLVGYFNEREMKASIVDPSGCADTVYRTLGGSVHVEVCRSEDEVSRPLDILVVEDTPDSLDFVKTLLESAGHRVTAVATGREAIKAGEAGTFDLVLLDLVLPDVDGVSVARSLAGKKARLVAMSAFLDRWADADYRRAGFARTLRKPFRTLDLLESLKC
jgi:CheY-like chemotaxis protein